VGDDEKNVLATIPGEHIAKAALMLPDAESASNEPQHVEILLRRRWYRLTSSASNTSATRRPAGSGPLRQQSLSTMSDIDVLSTLPEELLVTVASKFPDPKTATETFQRVIRRLPDGHRAEIKFVRLSEKAGRSVQWSWTPAGAALIE
jgi:hypothetical protein